MRIEHVTVRLPGHSLRARVRPGGDGAPPGVVWFEAGLGLDSSMWLPVMDTLDDHAETDGWTFLSPDRAGLGASTPGHREATLTPTLRDADAMLATAWAGPPTPLVLVGHSWGGTLQRLWSAAHPGSACAAVLVDASWEGGPEHPGREGRAALTRLVHRGWEDVAETLLHDTGIRGLVPTLHAQLLELRRFVPSLDLLDHLSREGRDWMPGKTALLTTARTRGAQVRVQRRFAEEHGWELRSAHTDSHMIPEQDPGSVATAILRAITPAGARRGR